MRVSKKFLGLAMSAIMLAGQTMPVLAANATTTGANANILDFAVDTIVVPTTMKVAINPNNYDITTKYEKATGTYDADETYYTKGASGYTKVATSSSTEFDAGDYYQPVTASGQIVSLNYGIVSKSTESKDVKIAFKASYTGTSAAGSSTAIQFVAEETFTATDDAFKICMKVKSANTDVPTTDTYAKTADATVDASKTYYTKSSSAYTKVASPEATALKTYYEATTTIGTEIAPAELADVTMTQTTAASGAATFVAGTNNDAEAAIAYRLDKATYDLKDGEKIDFDTTQSELKNKLELTDIGGVAAFTLTGTVNANANWLNADADKIAITPVYQIIDTPLDDIANASATVNDTCGQLAVLPTVTDAAPSIAVVDYKATSGQALAVTINLGAGSKAATGIASFTNMSTGSAVPEARYTFSGTTLTLDSTFITNNKTLIDTANGLKLKVTFNDTAKTAVTITVKAS